MAKLRTVEVKSKISSRLLWADVVRILAIYLVVATHSSGANNFTKIGVPLFVLLSGSLLLPKQETYKTFFKKRVLKVLVPWIIWTFLYMAFNFYFHDYRPASVSDWKYFFELTFLTQLWFLPLIFGLYLITPAIKIFNNSAKKIDRIYILIFWFLLVSILPFLHESLAFPSAQSFSLFFVTLQFSGYFLLGYVLANSKISKKLIYLGIVLFLISLFSNFLSIFHIASRYTDRISANYLSPGIVVSSALVFYLLFFFLTKWDKKIHLKIKNFLKIVSGATFGVYLIHVMILYFAQKLIPHFPPAVFTFTIFAVSTIIVLIIKQIPVLKRIAP